MQTAPLLTGPFVWKGTSYDTPTLPSEHGRCNYIGHFSESKMAGGHMGQNLGTNRTAWVETHRLLKCASP